MKMVVGRFHLAAQIVGIAESAEGSRETLLPADLLGIRERQFMFTEAPLTFWSP